MCISPDIAGLFLNCGANRFDWLKLNFGWTSPTFNLAHKMGLGKENTTEEERRLIPWGKLSYIGFPNAKDSTSIHCRKALTRVGREKARSVTNEIVFDDHYISSIVRSSI